MRDKNKNKQYFIDYINKINGMRENVVEWIKIGKIPQERVPIMLNETFRMYIKLMWAKYSMGEPIELLVEDYLQALNHMYQSWLKLPLKAYKNNVYYNHYFGGTYDQMLEMLSFGILLNQPKETFLKLADIIDKDEVKDLLYEFILKIKIPERDELTTESYSEIQNMPTEFKNLRLAIKENNKVKAASLVDTFFTKDWVNRAKKEGGKNAFNDYNNPNNTYTGYWNFYVPAICLLLDIDVSNFENNLYFPRDIYYYGKKSNIS
jgi:hypothetical protein